MKTPTASIIIDKHTHTHNHQQYRSIGFPRDSRASSHDFAPIQIYMRASSRTCCPRGLRAAHFLCPKKKTPEEKEVFPIYIYIYIKSIKPSQIRATRANQQNRSESHLESHLRSPSIDHHTIYPNNHAQKTPFCICTKQTHSHTKQTFLALPYTLHRNRSKTQMTIYRNIIPPKRRKNEDRNAPPVSAPIRHDDGRSHYSAHIKLTRTEQNAREIDGESSEQYILG